MTGSRFAVGLAETRFEIDLSLDRIAGQQVTQTISLSGVKPALLPTKPGPDVTAVNSTETEPAPDPRFLA